MKKDAIKIFFDDGTDAPYSMHLVSQQTDRLIPASESGRDLFLVRWLEMQSSCSRGP